MLEKPCNQLYLFLLNKNILSTFPHRSLDGWLSKHVTFLQISLNCFLFNNIFNGTSPFTLFYNKTVKRATKVIDILLVQKQNRKEKKKKYWIYSRESLMWKINVCFYSHVVVVCIYYICSVICGFASHLVNEKFSN